MSYCQDEREIIPEARIRLPLQGGDIHTWTVIPDGALRADPESRCCRYRRTRTPDSGFALARAPE